MRRLTIERTMVVVLFAALFAIAARVPVDTDTWWHIRSGETILQQGFIYTDLFSFTMQGQPWIDHSWGAQVILYAVWQVGGYLGLSVYMAALATAGMVFVYRTCTGSAYLRAFALVIGAATAAVFWSPRPQMLSFFLSTVVLYLLYSYKREHNDRLWLIPILMGLWGNLHAGFSIGFIFLLGFIAGETLGNLFNPRGENVIPWRGVRHLVVITVVSVAALVVNPYGLQMLLVPFQTVSIGALQAFIQEWNSPNFHERQTWPFVALLLGLLGAVGASRKRLDWTDFVLVSGTAFMGLMAGRNIAVFAIVATPVLTFHVNALLEERGWVIKPLKTTTRRMARLNLALALVALLAALAKTLIVLDNKTVLPALEAALPVKAADYVESARPPPPMFNSYNWGGYLMFRLPDYPVFVDGRTDLYGDEFLTHAYYETATGASGWRETLNEYGINTVVVETASGLARSLREEAGWRLDYEDDLAVVFVREGANDEG
jgi:hypothetical protein